MKPRPLAGPVASTTSCDTPCSEPAAAPIPQTTSGGNRPRKQRGPYATSSVVERLARSLSDRERSVVTTIGNVRMATADQLGRLHFADVSQRERRRTLAGLVDRGFLYRLPRVIGGIRAGSAGFAYAAGLAAQRLNASVDRRIQRPWLPGGMFMAHMLAVTELLVRLVEAQRASELGLRLFAAEPRCWRTFIAPGSGVPTLLKADAYIELTVNGYRDHWFVEQDLGTESTRTLALKCEQYRRYWISGREQNENGVFPRVLFVVPDERRQAQLVEIFSRQPEDAWPLFSVCSARDVIDRLRRGADR